MSKELDQRITADWKRFGAHKNFVKDYKKPLCLKRKIMDAVMHITSNDKRRRNMDTHQISREKAGSSPK